MNSSNTNTYRNTNDINLINILNNMYIDNNRHLDILLNAVNNLIENNVQIRNCIIGIINSNYNLHSNNNSRRVNPRRWENQNPDRFF